MLQAIYLSPIELHQTPDWSDRPYNIHRDPLWKTEKQGKEFDDVWFYHCDHLGTPQEMTDHTGAIIWKAEYKAWGECKAEEAKSNFFENSEIISNNIRFQGQYFDEETGLHYNRYRYYSPYVGRFVSKDPIGLLGGFNVYSYAPNPITKIDPLGLKQGGYSCPDAAAKAALNSANPKSIRLNREYGGLIYEKGGKYFHTIPVAGGDRTFKPILALPQIPRGATIVGDYHTHGDYSTTDNKGNVIRTNKANATLDSDNFSLADQRITMAARLKNRCHKSYLGTPSGKFKVNGPKGDYEL
ncbi:DUF4329 domain-containing protein [Acinetobacter baumannii]|nr:DUF4329 domain-containing protein [Acinetobacter baumannii]HCI7193962.1 DUF4329 domain-containing protein [Acinetobacter baumannii]